MKKNAPQARLLMEQNAPQARLIMCRTKCAAGKTYNVPQAKGFDKVLLGTLSY